MLRGKGKNNLGKYLDLHTVTRLVGCGSPVSRNHRNQNSESMLRGNGKNNLGKYLDLHTVTRLVGCGSPVSRNHRNQNSDSMLRGKGKNNLGKYLDLHTVVDDMLQIALFRRKIQFPLFRFPAHPEWCEIWCNRSGYKIHIFIVLTNVQISRTNLDPVCMLFRILF